MLISGIEFAINLEGRWVEVTEKLILQISLTIEKDRQSFVFWLHHKNQLLEISFTNNLFYFQQQTYLIPMGNNVCQQCNPCSEYQDLSYLDVSFLRDRVNESDLVQRLIITTSVTKNEILETLINRNQFIVSEEQMGIIFKPQWGYYEGSVNLANKPQGSGNLILRNLNMYKGSFKDGRFHGYGYVIDKQNQKRFNGTWNEGLPQSGSLFSLIESGRPIILTEIAKINRKKFFAEVKLPNGIIYHGEFLLKNLTWFVFQGKGKAIFPDGSSYEGEWMNGRMEGSGKYTWANGDYYDGHYVKGVKYGLGVMFWKAENKNYSGQWINGQIAPSSIISSAIVVEEPLSQIQSE